jgi:hypothetical protein
MKAVKLLAVAVDPAAADRWYVTNGTTAIGPVNLDLLERGIEAGKVPLESYVRHEGWKIWRPLTELVTEEEPFDPRRTSRDLKPVHMAGLVPLPPPSTDDVCSPARPTLPEEMQPDDAFAGSADLPEALLLLMSAAVHQVEATTALVHEVREDGAVVVCSHGERLFDVLGERTSYLDPVLIAAASGTAVVSEPAPGAAGRAMLERLARGGDAPAAAMMVPIRPRGRLVAFLELGRTTPFRARQVASVEALVDALVLTIESSGWALARVPG